MAQAGLLGEYKGSQAREVTMTLEEYDAIRAQAEAEAGDAECRPRPEHAPASERDGFDGIERDRREHDDERRTSDGTERRPERARGAAALLVALAAGLAVGALAGELSLVAAFTARHLSSAHESLGR